MVLRAAHDQGVDVGIGRGATPFRPREEQRAIGRLIGHVQEEEAPVARLGAPAPVVGAEDGAVVVQVVRLRLGDVLATELDGAGEAFRPVLLRARHHRDLDRDHHRLAAVVEHDRTRVHAVGRVRGHVDVRAEGATRRRRSGDPCPVGVLVPVDLDLEIRDRDGRAASLVLQAEEDPIGHPLVRVADEVHQGVGARPVVHEPDVLALVHLRGGEVEVEVAVDVRDRREVGVVDDAVTARIGPQVAVVVDIGPAVGEQPPRLVLLVVAVRIELGARDSSRG